MSVSRRSFMKSAALAGGGLCLPGNELDAGAASAGRRATLPRLKGNRFITFNTVIRVNQIEVRRDRNEGVDEALHTLEAVRDLRAAFEPGFPGGRMTWAFSWLALQDPRPNYQDIRRLVKGFHHEHGDEVTFIPGGYFAPMYNPREQVNRDLHDALALVSELVGGGYRPRSVVAGFLAAENLRYLAEEEGIHVCQGNIWSQYAIDNGDGDGSICYPYYPSREHFCKPAQGRADFIDCVNLDGWTLRFPGGAAAGLRRRLQQPHGRGPDRDHPHASARRRGCAR